MHVFGFYLGAHQIILGLGLILAFTNGFRNAGTIVATIVSTRVLTPFVAFILCAFFQFTGVLVLGTTISLALQSKIISIHQFFPLQTMLAVIFSSLASAFLWGLISWWRVWPTSSSHGLLAGFIGSSFSAWGMPALHSSNLGAIVLVLITSPLLGFVMAIIMTRFIQFIGQWLTERVLPAIEKLHILSCIALACAQGSNDGQMLMGILTVALIPAIGLKPGSTLPVPLSLKLMVASALALGVLMGGRRLLKKLGMSFYRIHTVEGLSAQLTSALTILTCSSQGLPSSTTHIVTGAIIGAGSAQSLKSLRWDIVEGMVLSWFFTLPAASLGGFIIYQCVSHMVVIR